MGYWLIKIYINFIFQGPNPPDPIKFNLPGLRKNHGVRVQKIKSMGSGSQIPRNSMDMLEIPLDCLGIPMKILGIPWISCEFLGKK